MVKICHESRIAKAFGEKLAQLYERIRWHQELNGGEPWAYQLTQLAEDLSISKKHLLRVAEDLESLEVNGKPVLIRKRGRHQVLWEVTASEEVMIELAEKLPDVTSTFKKLPDVTSKDDKKLPNVNSYPKKLPNVTSYPAFVDSEKLPDVTSNGTKCHFLNDPLNKNARKNELREFNTEEETSSNEEAKKKRFKRKVAQPAPSQLNLASVESICEEAIRRTKLPADHAEHQASNPILVSYFDWLDRDIWRDYHAKRETLSADWTYVAAKNSLLVFRNVMSKPRKGEPPLTADEVHDFMIDFLAKGTGQAPNPSWMFHHCRGNQFFQHSKPKPKPKPSLGDTLAARDESNPIKDITPTLKQIG
jgi:hypothetical protein